jgi:hypothetical protein
MVLAGLLQLLVHAACSMKRCSEASAAAFDSTAPVTGHT